MLENLHFTYDGKSSKDFGVILVNPGGGLYQESFLPNRKIVETKVAGRDIPFFQRVEHDPLSFVLHIYIKDWKERNNLRQISRWLFKPYYKELRFESNPDVVYYAMIEGGSELTHNGLFQGYISLTVRLNSPYMYSTPHEDKFSVNGQTVRSYYNNGDLPLRFNMEILHKDGTGISVIDESKGIWFALPDLLQNETVYVDGVNEIITSSLEKTHNRYIQGLSQDLYIEIPPESSAELLFAGNADFKITYEYIYLNMDIELRSVGVCW